MKNIFLLDMDDTLLDFQKAERHNIKITLAAYGIDPSDELVSRFHIINDDLWKALERGEITRERLKVKRFELLFEEKKLKSRGGTVEDVAHTYWANFPEICFPFDGALSFLKALSQRGRIYLVTNGGSVIQRRHIALAKMEPYLSGVFISEEIGLNKPTKEFADHVKSHIEGYDDSRAVWIGDSLSSDGKCAQNGGIDFILFAPQGDFKNYSGFTAKNYEEILALLKNTL